LLQRKEAGRDPDLLLKAPGASRPGVERLRAIAAGRDRLHRISIGSAASQAIVSL
jgi:hypothetical protein